MMRDSLLAGLIELGHSVTVPLDPRAPAPDLPSGTGDGALWPVLMPEEPEAARQRLLALPAAGTSLLLIGPDSEPALSTLLERADAAGASLLGSDGPTLALAADKWRTNQALAAAGVPALPTRLADRPARFDGPAVLKPRTGVGCLNTRLLRDGMVPAAGADWVAEPLVEGVPLSLSMLCAHGQAWLLTVNRQLVRVGEDDAFHFDGVVVAGAEQHRAAMEPIAAGVAGAMPGLFGFAGVDVLATATGPVVVEVNPRPTTATTGLARALRANPLRWLVELGRGAPLDSLRAPLEPAPVELRVFD